MPSFVVYVSRLLIFEKNESYFKSKEEIWYSLLTETARFVVLPFTVRQNFVNPRNSSLITAVGTNRHSYLTNALKIATIAFLFFKMFWEKIILHNFAGNLDLLILKASIRVLRNYPLLPGVFNHWVYRKNRFYFFRNATHCSFLRYALTDIFKFCLLSCELHKQVPDSTASA